MIYERVKDIILSHLEIDESKITMESSITADMGADSLDLLDILMDIEEAYEITIPEKKIGVVLGDLVNYIETERPELCEEPQHHHEIAAAS